MEAISKFDFLGNVEKSIQEPPLGFVQIGDKICLRTLRSCGIDGDINKNIAKIVKTSSFWSVSWDIGGNIRGSSLYYYAIEFDSPLWNAYWTTLLGIEPLPEDFCFVGNNPAKAGMESFRGVILDTIVSGKWTYFNNKQKLAGFSHAPYAVHKEDPEYLKLLPKVDVKQSSALFMEELHNLGKFSPKKFEDLNKVEFKNLTDEILERLKLDIVKAK